MNKIRIKNFGPIKEGLKTADGWIDIRRVTVFIGNQGSGKSTVAKLISTMVWIEKALVRGDFDERDLTRDRFQLQCSYQNVSSYFKDNTQIDYKGMAFSISYSVEGVKVEKNEKNGYSFPKIMYVPAERNLVGSVRNVRSLKDLPSTLYTFADEYFDALADIRGALDIPLNNVTLEYEKLTEIASIKGKDYQVKLSEASSGFQSFVPLYLVTRYLADSLVKKRDRSTNRSSIEQERRLRSQVKEIMQDPSLSDEIKKARLQLLSEQLNYSAFVNIVEEPEQNLFPTSQQKAINELVAVSRQHKSNQLILTTHSPYLINYLTLSVKAQSILKNTDDQKERGKISEIVPLEAALIGSDLVVYEMEDVDGTIQQLEDYHGMPSDDNKLNDRLGDTNEQFARLLEIQQRL